MGPTSPVQALLSVDSVLSSPDTNDAGVSGMALMSTHPRDYDRVLHLSKTLTKQVQGPVKIVPCFGVHPWFLHELSSDDWKLLHGTPSWVQELETMINSNPNSIIGEIGLDGFHFDATSHELVSPMERQKEAFQLQMELAARLERPVSIHAVQCFGTLFDVLVNIKAKAKSSGIPEKTALPPKIYFHACSAKVGTIEQLLAACGRKPGKVFFGFAPIVNFRSAKTVDVVRKVGIDRLLLETDHEDAAHVPKSLEHCIEYLAKTLDMEAQDVIDRTTANALDFYNMK